MPPSLSTQDEDSENLHRKHLREAEQQSGEQAKRKDPGADSGVRAAARTTFRSKNHLVLWKKNRWKRSIKGTSTAKVMQSRREGGLMRL